MRQQQFVTSQYQIVRLNAWIYLYIVGHLEISLNFPFRRDTCIQKKEIDVHIASCTGYAVNSV